ncbi:2-haloacid dehalogenase [Brevibacterium sandarakinum]|uniref:2-haloacid dehalogenase n=1 Tax=Brevibacterium sandarakinum TaxID=629680 RepID=A0A1H1R9T9_BRESA|nr:haloacid dehalogenase type II [Brevibacterium sandarakinum]SDS32463.1 2-haloacid dehalogenase [Brevibacterium sandarakinum]
MSTSPSTIVFDVNETLSDMSPLAGLFEEVGAPGALAELWFTTLLRDGFALTAAGDNVGFSELGTDALHRLLTSVDLDRDRSQAVEHIMAGMASLRVHPDVPEGVRGLCQAGYRLITLSNGSTAIAESLLERAGIGDSFLSLLSVEDAPAWKPAAAAYHYAVLTCSAEPSEMMLVAVHPWDIHGAARAGLQTAWLNRSGASYPNCFSPPDNTVTDLTDLSSVLAARVA